MHDVEGHFLFLHSTFGVWFAILLPCVATRVIIDFELVVSVQLYDAVRPIHEDIDWRLMGPRGRLKIIVRLSPFAGPVLVAMLPSGNAIGYRLRSGGVLVFHFIFRTVFVDARLIGEHQYMLVLFVTKA